MPDDTPNDTPDSQDTATATSQGATAGVGRLREAAEALVEIAQALGHRDLAGAIADDARRRLDDGRVRAVILGEIKHGKSSLINALLGEALLPVGVTPTTGAVVAIRVGPDGQTGRFSLAADGSRAPLDDDHFDRLARGKQEPAAGETPELLVAAERLPATLELIDTPGFNDIARFRAALSRSELPRADALVLVLDATQVLSRSELGLIRDALAAVGGASAQSGAVVFLVINRIDLVPEEERPRIVEHIREGLATILPGELEPFLTNAKLALREPESDAPGVMAVNALRERLFGLAGRGREILPARARAAMLRHAKLLGYNAAVQSRALHLEREALTAEIRAVEAAAAAHERDLAELRRGIPEACAKIIAASGERQAKFRADLEEAALAQIQKADIKTLTQAVPGAIQDAFMEFVRQESERLRTELEAQTRELFATCSELARRRLLEATMPLGFRGPGFYVEPPKILVEVGTIALGVVGTVLWYLGNSVTGMVMTVAGPLATVVLREKTVRDARAQAKVVLPPALDEAVGELGRIVTQAVERHGEALDDHLTLADQALAEQLLASLRRAEERLAEHQARIPGAARPAVAEQPDGPEALEVTESSEAEATEVDRSVRASSSGESEGEGESEGVDEREAAAGAAASEAAEAGAAAGSGAGDTPPLPPEQAAKRLRERVVLAAHGELNRLEGRLDRLVDELRALDLDGRPAPAPAPTVIH
ncbi:dynamin family protein [Pseudenhygromyxa sp. WMMC2535]|uniref:dynamin family protein n=1 Tax=Pseudenhygromyxa sp. WMMC2535 TaxID=2712867 RepID=UPI001551F1E8|nr:dynamin family protein [Pseudenhygromyxa sp. WMMC2535]NVB38467.1 dynamin family protein [Pseudenhygromyxa sp. WMMC2535]